MANFVYVDNSNVWIEGMRVSAVKNGLAPDIWTANAEKIVDYGWRLDFGRLYDFAGGDADGRAVLYGSKPPPNDSMWKAAEHKGFEVVVFERSTSNREKKVDTQMAADIVSDSYERMKPDEDEITVVAGDSDYVPVVEKLRQRGFSCSVVFWEQAARELKESASKFISLDPYLEDLRLTQ